MLGPFDLPGPAFLQLYAILLAIAFVAALIIPRWLRPEGHDGHVTSPDDLAYLAGGAGRFADAVTTRLLSTGQIVFDGKDKFALSPAVAAAGAAERSVLALGGSQPWTAVHAAIKTQAEPIERRLVDHGLLMDGATAMQLRFWQAFPYVLLLAFGTIKLQIGISRDKPVGFLIIFLIVTTVFALIRFAVLERRTRGGQRVLADAREHSERLKRAPTNNEADLGVALFGTAVLAGSSWAPFHQMRVSSSSDGGGSDSGSSSSSSSSSDGGGSGCGGGGCGGCGGS